MANIYNSLANIGARSQEILSPSDAEIDNQKQQYDYNNDEPYIPDGDTTYFNGKGSRILGIDTPEMTSAKDLKTERLAQAKESKLGMFASKATAGEAAKLEAQLSVLDFDGIDAKGDVVKQDKYGRDLIENTDYKNRMIEKGYAVPTFFGDENDISSVEAMNRAKEAKRGLWADPEYAKEMVGIVDKRIMNSTGASNEVKNAAGYVNYKGTATANDYMKYAKEKDDSNWIDSLQALGKDATARSMYLAAQPLKLLDKKTAEGVEKAAKYTFENSELLSGYDFEGDGSSERSWGDVLPDFAKGVAKGAGNVVKGAGTLGGLITGDMEKDNNTLIRVGSYISDTMEKKYSPGLKASLAERQEAVDKENGEWAKFLTSAKATATDPTVLSNFIAETVASLLPGIGLGKFATSLGASGKAGVGIAVGANSALHGADVGQDTYDTLMKSDDKYWSSIPEYTELVKKGMSSKEAKAEISLDIARAVTGATGTVSAVLQKMTPGGTAIEDLLINKSNIASLGKAMSKTAVGTVGEAVTGGLEEGSGAFGKNVGVSQVKADQNLFEGVGDAAGTGLVAEGTLSGGIGATKVMPLVPGAISEARNNAYTKLGVDIPLGSTAKETGAVEPGLRTDYTKKIVEDTAELYFNPEKSFQAGYTDLSDEILTNATNRIMEVNELPEQTRDIVAGNLAKEMYYKLNEAGSDGETRIPREEGVSRLQNMLSKFKGNKYVEAVVAQESRNELNREADNIVLRLENDGINVNNLDEVVKSLSKEELTNLNKALDNMKIMGSEELTNRANTIQNMLESKRTEVLGSEAEDGVPPRKKTVEEVRAEIETLGFLTKNGMKKSLYDHDKDLLATVNNPLASEVEKDSVLTSLRTFVNSRTSKLNPININPADGLVKARTPLEIKKFAEINLEDNEKIAKVIVDALKRDYLTDTDKVELASMHEVLKDNQKYLDSIANVELNTPSELKKFYDDLLGDRKNTEAMAGMINKDVMDMMANFVPVKNTPKKEKAENKPQAKPMGNLSKYRELSNRQVELVNELEKGGISSSEVAQITKELAAVERAMEELSPKKVAEDKAVEPKTETEPESESQDKGPFTSTEQKLKYLLAAYDTKVAPKIGGGMIENVSEEAIYDEDVARATMQKGTQDASIRDMLPVVDGRSLIRYKNAVRAWYDGFNRSKKVKDSLEELLALLKTVEYNPMLVEEFGWNIPAQEESSELIPSLDELDNTPVKELDNNKIEVSSTKDKGGMWITSNIPIIEYNTNTKNVSKDNKAVVNTVISSVSRLAGVTWNNEAAVDKLSYVNDNSDDKKLQSLLGAVLGIDKELSDKVDSFDLSKRGNSTYSIDSLNDLVSDMADNYERLHNAKEAVFNHLSSEYGVAVTANHKESENVNTGSTTKLFFEKFVPDYMLSKAKTESKPESKSEAPKAEKVPQEIKKSVEEEKVTEVREPKIEETPKQEIKEETSKEEELLGSLLVEVKAGIEYTEMSKEEYDAELARLGEKLQSIESEYNELKEWIDTGKAIKKEHKKAINEAKEEIKESGVKEELSDIKTELRVLKQTKKTIENTIGYINRLERKHETALTKYKTAGNTIADMKKELDSINAQIEKQEKALEKNTSKALSGFSGNIINKAKDLINKIVKSLDRLYKQLVVKEAKIEKKEREYDTLAKDIKQLEKDLSRVKDDLGKMESLENINAKIDVLQDKKDAVQEEMDKLRARLDDVYALREKALGDQALGGEALAEVQEKATFLSRQIKAYKEAMTKWFRAPMAKILEGSKAKVSTSQSRGISHRLLSGYDIMDIMPKIFTRTEEGKATVREAMDLFKQFEADRSGTVIYQNVKDATDEHILVKTGLDKLFSMEAMSDPIVRAKLIKAMNVSTAITLGEMVDVKSQSDDQLYDFVKGAFANILPPEAKEKNKAIYELMDKVRQGKLVPLATFRANAGKRLLKELEVKLDTDTIGDRDNVENALGALVIENMLGKYDKGKAKRAVNLAKGTVVYDYDTATVEIKSGNSKEEHKAEAGESTTSVGIMDLSEMTAQEVSDINKIATVLEYAGDKTDGRISLSPVKVEEGSKVRNSDVKKGKDVEEYLNKQGSMAWKFSEDFKSIWEDIAGKDLGKLTEIILGNKEEVLSKASPIELESLQAKYEADALDIERMMMAYNLVGTDTEFYIGWDYAVNNRNMMSNKMINPQNSKISRFIISAKGMRHKLTVSEDELVGMEHAIAQAFDLDPDKEDDASVKESLAEFGIRLSIKDGKYKLQIADGAKGARLRKLIKDDKPVNPERIRNWFGVGTGHLMHAHQAIMLLKAINNNDGEIETNLALEADGITNGMASTALQMGLTDGTKGYYVKSGAYIQGHNVVNGKEIKSHGEFKKAKGLDFYETPIEDFKYYLGKDAEFIETTIKGKWRSFLKPLVMVLIYGAGVDNIVMSGSTDLVAKIINDGKNADEVKKVFTDLIKDMKVNHKTEGIRLASVNNAIERITLKSVKFNPDTGKAKLVNDKNGKVYIDQDGLTQLATLMSLKVGEPLKLAFRDSFAPVKNYRSVLKTIETMNYIIFQNEFDNKIKALGKETMSDLSEAELTKVKEELIAEGTYYGSNNYFGETQDYFNSEKVKDPNNKVKVVLTLPFARYLSSNIGSSSDIAGSLREIASNVGATGVVDIHSVDGATMIEGHINDVLNIFDALVMGLDPIANKEQMEAINQAYIDINMNHSILGRAVEKLYKNREKFANITRLKSTESIRNDLIRIYELSDSGTAAILDQIGNIGEQLDIMHRGRQDLRASDIDVKQYYIADALGGGKWTANTKIPEGSRPYIFSDKKSEAKKERDAINSMLSKLEDLVINIPVQEALAGIKAGDGIISQQVSKEDAKLIDELSNSAKC